MIVVDTSVALKWVVAEQGSSDALNLISTPLVAPDLIQAEIGGALTKKVRLRQLTADQARAGWEAATERVSLLPSRAFATRALDLSLELHHSIYDCYFLAAAEAEGLFLITADHRFGTKVRDTKLASLLILLGEDVPNAR